MDDKKEIMITAVDSSGSMTIGNYLAVIKTLMKYQDEYNLYLFVANLHAITTPQDPKKLKESIKTIATLYFAAGIDPNKTITFIQSDVLEHAELGWILNTQSNMGELERMTQYKDKSAKAMKAGNGTTYIPAGLFTYPTLMAADILLYNAKYVPVGIDQTQHIELARNLATRMNNNFDLDFVLPEAKLNDDILKIMDLQYPDKKMSKSSENEKSVIRVLDEPDVIRKKIGSAITDSENLVKYDPKNKPGVSNLMTILKAVTGEDYASMEKRFAGKSYKDFKDDVADALVKELEPVQKKFKELYNSEQVDQWLAEGADKARYVASKTLNKVKNHMGLNYKRK